MLDDDGVLGLLVAVVAPRPARMCTVFLLVMNLVDGEIIGVPMNETLSSIMSWNVRGLNFPAKRAAISEAADAHRLAILALQETKIEIWTPAVAAEVGGSRLQGCVVLPATGSRGGAAIFWDKSRVSITSHAIGRFSITAKVDFLQGGPSFWMTTVYGPTDDTSKEQFLNELAAAAPLSGEPWLLNGDFNMIYEARDKSTPNLHRRIMGRFRRALDFAGLREIKCKNRRYTWSNEREDPVFCSIDKFFCNLEWESLMPNHMLMAAATTVSDHCRLLLSSSVSPARPARFKFESFWPAFPRFHETVTRAWDRQVQHDCPFRRIKIK